MNTSIRAVMQPVRGSDVHPLKWAFERGSQLGFNGLELCMVADSRPISSTQLTPEIRHGITALSKEYKMPIYSLSADWLWAYGAFFPTYAGWGRSIELLAEDARLAREVGAHSILMHFARSKGTWEECRALLRDVAAVGKEYGVRFGYESNVWAVGPGFGELDSLVRMVDEVGSAYFGVYMHNSWPRAGQPLELEMEQCGTRLMQTMHFVSLVTGQVQVDWPKAFVAMKKYFADGACTLEGPWEHAEENKKLLDEAIAKYW